MAEYPDLNTLIGTVNPSFGETGFDNAVIPQLINIWLDVGAFRKLKREAVATPGSFYFTCWIYGSAASTGDGLPGQTPTGVDQGLLIPGRAPRIERHGN